MCYTTFPRITAGTQSHGQENKLIWLSNKWNIMGYFEGNMSRWGKMLLIKQPYTTYFPNGLPSHSSWSFYTLY